MTDDLFLDAVAAAIDVYEDVIGRHAVATHSMIKQYGEVGALSRLVVSPDLQDGFKVLRDTDNLKSTFEALVVRFADKFDPEVVKAAQWRLDNPFGLLPPDRS
jgi:hypothetical protein